MEDFDTTALEDIINCLNIDLPSLESRFTGYLEIISNAAQEKTQVYALKFENVIFHSDKFHGDDIEGKALTPNVMPISSECEKFIHVPDEIPIYGINKLLKKCKKTTVMALQEISSKWGNCNWMEWEELMAWMRVRNIN